jgi:hypothetical protein
VRATIRCGSGGIECILRRRWSEPAFAGIPMTKPIMVSPERSRLASNHGAR